ncbi:MAG: hypothetical protein ACJAZX_001030 [Rickettsiales bacterium]|jgi:hypothetical protein
MTLEYLDPESLDKHITNSLEIHKTPSDELKKDISIFELFLIKPKITPTSLQ